MGNGADVIKKYECDVCQHEWLSTERDLVLDYDYRCPACGSTLIYEQDEVDNGS